MTLSVEFFRTLFVIFLSLNEYAATQSLHILYINRANLTPKYYEHNAITLTSVRHDASHIVQRYEFIVEPTTRQLLSSIEIIFIHFFAAVMTAFSVYFFARTLCAICNMLHLAIQKSLFRNPKEPILERERAYLGSPNRLFRKMVCKLCCRELRQMGVISTSNVR